MYGKFEAEKTAHKTLSPGPHLQPLTEGIVLGYFLWYKLFIGWDTSDWVTRVTLTAA